MNNRLKIFIDGDFNGFTSFGIDYLYDNFNKMITKNVNIKGQGINYGHVIDGEAINNGYKFYTNKNIEIKYVEE